MWLCIPGGKRYLQSGQETRSLRVSLNEQRKACGGERCVYLVGGRVVAPGLLRQGLAVELQCSWLRIHNSYDLIRTNGGRSAYDA